MTTNELKEQAYRAASELLEQAGVKPGGLMVVGCSSSEICGERIGTGRSPETAEAVLCGITEAIGARGISLAAQCCEHLNRALVVERETAERLGLTQVSVLPRPEAGGSFATAAWKSFRDPVAVEAVKADCGLDIGGTLIGMHLKAVAVPVRLKTDRIGEAAVTAARTRPKLIGGSRAVYDPALS